MQYGATQIYLVVAHIRPPHVSCGLHRVSTVTVAAVKDFDADESLGSYIKGQLRFSTTKGSVVETSDDAEVLVDEADGCEECANLLDTARVSVLYRRRSVQRVRDIQI